ncbi:MAG: NAD-binding protein [Gammaproteobacteria bacterium]|nr:NAD-binding protein [Gammaproteobacteria bacterium]
MSYKRVDRIYWIIIILLAVATVCMNIIGLYLDSNTDRSLPPEVLFLEILDRTLLLFLAEGRGFPIDDDNYLPRIARILSAIVILGAIVKLALEILVQRWEKLKISRLKGHMIICGLGEGGQAFAFNISKDTPILIIDPNLSEADEFQAYENGWYFIKADARESTALLTAGLTKAKGMVISCGDDTVNMEILEQAQQIFEDKKHTKPFTFLLEVSSDQLSESISDQFIMNNLHETIELFTYSRPRLTARELVWNVQLSEYARFRNQERIQLIFIGYDAYAEAMIDKLVSASIVSGLSAMQISIFTKAPDSELEVLLDKYRFASDYLYIEGFESEDLWATLKTKSFETVTALFIFDEEDKSCVNKAIATRDFLLQNNRDQAPIFMRLDRDFALKDLLVGTEDTYRMGEVLQAFGMNNKICHPDLIMGELENIAIQLHEQYLEFSTRELDDAEKQKKVSSYQPWRMLSETKKNANRRSVDHIPAKLAAIGVYHQPGYGLKLPSDAVLFSTNADCLEHLAELEQKSWSAGKYAEGWIPGKVRDDRRKIHDSLQYRYHELTETLKGYDRDQIQLLDHIFLSVLDRGRLQISPKLS